MASKAIWGAGLGVGFTWTQAFKTAATADLPSLASGSSVLSNYADITNQTALDMFCDVSVQCAIASSTIAAGANFALYIYALNSDGTTYGDNQFTAGTQAAKTPSVFPCATIPIYAAASTTTIKGNAIGIVIPPGTFRFVFQNNSGFALTSAAQVCDYRTYLQNLNG